MLGVAIVILLSGCAATPASGDADAVSPGAVGQAEPTEPTSELTQRQQRQIDLIAPILLSPPNGPDDGRMLAAAQELLALGLPQADEILRQAMRSGNRAQVLAVLRAMITEEQSLQPFMEVAVELLTTAQPEVQETLWRLLARNERALLADVSTIALDQQTPLEHRLNAIGAMGEFRTRDAADHLITLLDENRQEPEAIITAVCEALTRLTRLPYGNRPDTWRAWWVQARDQTREQWLVDQVQRLATERAELERELTLQRQRIHRIEQRVVEVLRDLFRAMPTDVEQQLAPLPTLLDDELAVVREFAIERIRFVSRDHEIPGTLKSALASRLDDPEASIRQRAARLLHELNYANLNEMLAARLANETIFDVIAAYVELLTARPTPAAADALIARLTDANLCDAAANAIWRIIEQFGDDAMSPEARAALEAQLNEQLQNRTSPPLLRLSVYLMDQQQLDEAAAYLDHEDAGVRTAVAEAMARRSYVAPLVERSDDPAVYPTAVQAVASEEATIATLLRVLDMKPPTDATVTPWQGAISRLLARLPGPALVEADKLLVRSKMPQAIRLDLLTRAMGLPAEDMTVAHRSELALHLGQLRLERKQYDRAHQELESITAVDASAELIDLKFLAALCSGHFNRAAELRPEPELWIDALASVTETDPPLALRVQTEIDQRFGESLDEALRARLEALREQLSGDQSVPSDPAAANASEPTSSS